MRLVRFVALPGLLLGLTAGCGKDSSFGDVRGEVTFEGKPLKEGVVRFVPVDGNTPTASALIVEGKFAERVPVATHRVEISSPKLPRGVNSAKELKRGTVDEGAALEEMIPERYNSRSTLTKDIRPGVNELRFDLQSK
jgi:hypothetical protein